MNANEIRVCQTYILFGLLKTLSFSDFSDFSLLVDQLKPVEITEEIMLNCKQYTKWQWFGEDWWGGYIPFVDGNKLMIRKVNDKFIFTICTINKVRDTFCSIRKLGVKIKYLHELQNLYFSFRGEELVFSTEP